VVGKGIHQKLGALIIKPFTKWKVAIERFSRHSNSEYHKLSIIRSEEFIKVMENKKIILQIRWILHEKNQVIENRSILRPSYLLCIKTIRRVLKYRNITYSFSTFNFY